MRIPLRMLLAGVVTTFAAACAASLSVPPSTAAPSLPAAAANASAASTPRGATAIATSSPISSAIIAALGPPSPAPSPAAAVTPDGYHLVWHDEFDKDGPLNPADWGYENGFVRNQEAQYYQPDNALCQGGFLIIQARQESKPNPRYIAPGTAGNVGRDSVPATTSRPATTASTIPGSAPATATSTAPARGRGRGRGAGGAGGGSNAWPNLPTITITAASVNTRGKHEFTYGRFEIRARIDTRPGSWPAFWTLGTSGGWPGNGEIDIMEYYRNMVLANIAWQGPSGAVWNSIRNPLNSFPADFSRKFHTWRMDWTPQAIDLFLDDVRVNHQDLAQTVNTAGRANGINPFLDKPVYLLLNQAIGGQNGGDYSQTQFPINFYIDYVRVYQKPPATQPK